jgi:poly-gamma-glutamate synthesis protein (capsule biosynthesis protein)
MTREPIDHVRTAARTLVDAGADLVAGHSAHLAHGVAPPVLYDLGDFIDDYAVDPRLRNDLGLLFLVTVGVDGPENLEAVPIKLEFCYTTVAQGQEAAWLRHRFTEACAALGAEADVRPDGRIVMPMH